ncbi:MAG: hypothetical protein WBX00_33235 [Isosphaeraceae bacterium]
MNDLDASDDEQDPLDSLGNIAFKPEEKLGMELGYNLSVMKGFLVTCNGFFKHEIRKRLEALSIAKRKAEGEAREEQQERNTRTSRDFIYGVYKQRVDRAVELGWGSREHLESVFLSDEVISRLVKEEEAEYEKRRGWGHGQVEAKLDFEKSDVEDVQSYLMNMLRKCVFMGSYAALELSLSKACELDGKPPGNSIGQRSVLDDVKGYIDDKKGRGFLKERGRWSRIDRLRKLRNRIAHSNGELHKSDCIYKFIHEHQDVELLNGSLLFLKDRFCENAIHEFAEFGAHLLSGLFGKQSVTFMKIYDYGVVR